MNPEPQTPSEPQPKDRPNEEPVPDRRGHWTFVGTVLGAFIGLLVGKFALGMLFGFFVGIFVGSAKHMTAVARSRSAPPDHRG